MANVATFANGTKFFVGGTTVSEVTNVGGPNLSADTVDVTSHDATENYKEFIQGLRDGGDISVEGNFTTAGATAIVAAFNTTSVQNARILMPTKPSASLWSASVICTSFENEAPVDDKIGFKAKFKVTGKPVLSQV